MSVPLGFPPIFHRVNALGVGIDNLRTSDPPTTCGDGRKGSIRITGREHYPFMLELFSRLPGVVTVPEG